METYKILVPNVAVNSDLARLLVKQCIADNMISMGEECEIVVSVMGTTNVSKTFMIDLAHMLVSYRLTNVTVKGTLPDFEYFTECFDHFVALDKTAYMTKDALIEQIKDFPGDAIITVTISTEPSNIGSYYWHNKGLAKPLSVGGQQDVIVLEL